MQHRFKAALSARGPKSAWIFLPIPLEVSAAFETRGRVPVRGTLNGFPFRTSLMPEGDGTHAMAVRKELRAGAKAAAGDVVEVVLERDVAERVVDVPAELEGAWRDSAAARRAFEALAYSHRKEYAEWIAAGKKPETRAARAAKAVGMLSAGKRFGERT